jgi:hypothetical protein
MRTPPIGVTAPNQRSSVATNMNKLKENTVHPESSRNAGNFSESLPERPIAKSAEAWISKYWAAIRQVSKSFVETWSRKACEPNAPAATATAASIAPAMAILLNASA